MATAPRSFRLTDQDQERLYRLSREIGCTSTDAVRYGLIALKTFVDDGYEFRDLHRTMIFRRTNDGKTITFFDISEDGALIGKEPIDPPIAPDDEGRA